MKRLDSLGNKKSKFVSLWIIFHVIIFALFFVRLFINHGQISLDADLFNITPRPIDSEPLKKADEKLSETTGNNVFILVSNPDYEKAKEAAEAVCAGLDGSDNFISVTLQNDTGSYSEIGIFFLNTDGIFLTTNLLT